METEGAGEADPAPSHPGAMPSRWKSGRNMLRCLHYHIGDLQPNTYTHILYLSLFELNASVHGSTIWGLYHLGKEEVKECIKITQIFLFISSFVVLLFKSP